MSICVKDWPDVETKGQNKSLEEIGGREYLWLRGLASTETKAEIEVGAASCEIDICSFPFYSPRSRVHSDRLGAVWASTRSNRLSQPESYQDLGDWAESTLSRSQNRSEGRLASQSRLGDRLRVDSRLGLVSAPAESDMNQLSRLRLGRYFEPRPIYGGDF